MRNFTTIALDKENRFDVWFIIFLFKEEYSQGKGREVVNFTINYLVFVEYKASTSMYLLMHKTIFKGY